MVRFVYVISYYADKFEEAIEHLTEAISLNPTSAIMYATRGTLSFFCKVSCWSYGKVVRMRFVCTISSMLLIL